MTCVFSFAAGAWRLHVATVGAQLLSAVGVYCFGSFADPRKALWVGAAVASFPGVLIGVA